MMVLRPSVLAVTSEVPWPLNSGGHLRTFHLLRTLAQRFDVRLIVPTRGDDGTGRVALEQAGIAVRMIPVPPRTRLAEAIKVAASAAQREPYVMFARHRSGAVRARWPSRRPIDAPTCSTSIISTRWSTPTRCRACRW